MRNKFRNIFPPATLALLLANIIIFTIEGLCDMVSIGGVTFNDIIIRYFGLHYIFSGNFDFWQPLTYMFLHADLSHLFCNMFAVWMFGRVLEEHWGSRRYLLYYFVTGLGAAFVQEGVQLIQHFAFHNIVTGPTIGASGAVFGLLLAYAFLFPQARIFIFPIPIPIRAWIMVSIYAFIEFFAGFSGGDHVAHFAHLGGMLFGLIFILVWKKRGVNASTESFFRKWANKRKYKRQQREEQRKEKKGKYQDFHYSEPVNENKADAYNKQEREAEINRILDKVKFSGYDALTDEEKRTLFSK